MFRTRGGCPTHQIHKNWATTKGTLIACDALATFGLSSENQNPTNPKQQQKLNRKFPILPFSTISPIIHGRITSFQSLTLFYLNDDNTIRDYREFLLCTRDLPPELVDIPPQQGLSQLSY